MDIFKKNEIQQCNTVENKVLSTFLILSFAGRKHTLKPIQSVYELGMCLGNSPFVSEISKIPSTLMLKFRFHKKATKYAKNHCCFEVY